MIINMMSPYIELPIVLTFTAQCNWWVCDHWVIYIRTLSVDVGCLNIVVSCAAGHRCHG